MTPINDVVYDGFSFVDNGIVLTNIDHMRIAKRDNQIENRANREGGVLVQSQLGTKPIYIDGYYVGTDIYAAQLMYDVLAQVLNRQQRPLIIPHAGSTRQYTATPENIIISQPDGYNRITFSFEFVVPDGSSSEQTSTDLFTDATITTASSTITLNVAGSVTARPLLNLTFTSVTGGTGKSVTIRNARDFIGLTFARDFVSGDTISIDSKEFQIYINGVLTEPDGRMPTWSPGSGALFYSDTFSGRSVDISGSYTQRNL